VRWRWLRRAQETDRRVAQRGDLCGREGEPRCEVIERTSEVPELPFAVVQAIAHADDRVVMKKVRCPGSGQTRANIARVRIIERAAGWAEASTGNRVEGKIATFDLMEHAKVVVAKAEAKRDVGTKFVLILDEEVVFGLPHSFRWHGSKDVAASMALATPCSDAVFPKCDIDGVDNGVSSGVLRLL
jgi:hypothetical protein